MESVELVLLIKKGATVDITVIGSQKNARPTITKNFANQRSQKNPSRWSQKNPKKNCSKFKISTNKRCSPHFGDTYCPPKHYCTKYSWWGKQKNKLTGHNELKFSWIDVPRKWRKRCKNSLKAEENVNLLEINSYHKRSDGYSGEFILCALIIGMFLSYVTFKIFSRKNSKDNGDNRFEIVPIISVD